MKKGKKQTRRYKEPPATKKQVRISYEIGELDQSLFKWRVHNNYVDLDHDEWGWGKVPIEQFFKILAERLHQYEEMTWQELLNRKHCHDKTVPEIDSKAQTRLSEKCPDIDTLYQIDIKKMGRIWGYRDRRYLYLIWHDPNHTVCPTRRR